MNGSRLLCLLLAIGTLTLAACGSSDKPSVAAAHADPLLNFAHCMRAHGVPNFPDPSPGGGIQITPRSGVDPQSPAFLDAQQACKQFAGPIGGLPRMSESERREALRFAECMRANGQPNFPDPTLIPSPRATRVLVLRGMVFAFGAGIDPKSPGFKTAATACGVSPP